MARLPEYRGGAPQADVSPQVEAPGSAQHHLPPLRHPTTSPPPLAPPHQHQCPHRRQPESQHPRKHQHLHPHPRQRQTTDNARAIANTTKPAWLYAWFSILVWSASAWAPNSATTPGTHYLSKRLDNSSRKGSCHPPQTAPNTSMGSTRRRRPRNAGEQNHVVATPTLRTAR